MASTVRFPILGFGFQFDSSGKCVPDPWDTLASNDFVKGNVIRFDEDGNNNAQITTKAGFYGRFKIPKDYSTTPKAVISWTSTIGSGDCVWDFDYRTAAVGETLDSASWQESVTATTTAPSARNSIETSIALTAGNFAVDDIVQYFCGCDGVDAADTLAGARLLFNLEFEYVTT